MNFKMDPSTLTPKMSRWRLPSLVLFCVLCVLPSSLSFTFTTQPQSLTVMEGTNIILSCAVDQTENIEYQWTLNDAVVTDSARIYIGTNNDLRINGVVKEDAGSYKCVVTDTASSQIVLSEPGILNVTWITDELRVQLKYPSSVELVEEGVRVNLVCKAVGELGSPPPQIVWFQDQIRIQADANLDFNGNRLKIKSTTAVNSGTYSCEATNSAGTKRSTEDITLDIVDANTPTVVVAPENALHVIGDSVQFHCEFSGDPTPPVRWYFIKTPDTPLDLQNDTETGTYIYPNGTLNMDNILESDKGEYQCVCDSIYGRPFTSAKLTIATVDPLPVFEPRLVVEDNTVFINCSYPAGEAGGNPAPSFQWLKPSGRALPSDDTKRIHVAEQGNLLVMGQVRKLDEGNYTCRASNIAGEQTQQIMIVVASEPKFDIKPENTNVVEGHQVMLHCAADPTSTPQPTISWVFDGSDAAASSLYTKKPVGEVLQNGSYVIYNAQKHHNGTYTCILTSVAGVKSANATLFFIAILKFNPPPVSTSLDKGELNRMVCHASAHREPFIRWVKIGSPGRWPPHVTVPRRGVLQFNPAKESDKGRYICIASTGLESINVTVNIDVVVKPKFVIRPNSTIGYEGFRLSLDCMARGDPEPTITWISKPIDDHPEHFVQFKNGTLFIEEVQARDAGKYQCIAGSDAGLNSAEVTLTVQKGRPPNVVPVPAQVMTRTIAIAVGCAAAYIILVVGLMLWCRQRRRRNRRKMMNSSEKPNGMVVTENEKMLNNHDDEKGGKMMPDGDIALNADLGKNGHQRGSYDKLQFPRHDMQTITVIGHGAYGEVSLSRAAGIKDGEEATTVMVKALQTKEESLQLDFRREIEMLGKLNHENIVKLLGVCRDTEPQLMITEYLDWGDLKQFLQATRGENGTKNVPPPLTMCQKIDIVNQVALGMEHLSANRFIHGDLAARNCLLSPSMEVKICTMSVSQDLYRSEYHEYHQKLIPVRWMPAEAIFEDELSTKSDVWAYGIFVWEVFSQGLLPYSKLDNDAVMRAMIDGELMLETPAETPDEVEIMMHRCWADSPKDRHTFADITHQLGRLSTDSRV